MSPMDPKNSAPPFLEGLDPDQRAAAAAELSCVVTAGAGAGKTSVLAARYLYLALEKKIPLPSILALTFTRKAAAEMHERIYRGLSAQGTEWAGRQLALFAKARISTLDSLCADICRQGCHCLGYAPDFAVDDARSALLAETVAYRYLGNNGRREGISELLDSFSFDEAARDFLAQVGREFATPLALEEKLFSPESRTLEDFCRDLHSRKASRLLELSSLLADLAAGLSAPRADCQAASKAALLFLELWDKGASYEALESLSPALEALAGLSMKAYGKGEEEQAVKEAAKAARETAKDLLSLKAYKANFHVQKACLERLDEYAAELAEAKRLSNLMDFKDLGACAVRFLIRDRRLRQAWKRDIRSIVVDEFQDNNSLQKDLLFLLAEREDRVSDSIPLEDALEEGKLFFVGDEKQSIYRFRGADVEVFRGLAQGLSAQGGERSQVLRRNYRSSEYLVRFFDGFFAQVFGNLEAPRAWDARHAAMEAGSSAQTRRPGMSTLRYFALPAEEGGQDGVDPDDLLAFHAASFIRDSAGSLRVGKEERPLGYGDIAVLLRASTHQHRLERYLRQFGIPYQSENPRGLFSQAPANDLYHILAYFLDPGDRRAFLALLRSPFCGLSPSGFALLAEADPPILVRPDPTLESLLSSQDAMSLARAREILGELKDAAKGGSAARAADYLWNQGGLRLDLLSRTAARPFVEHFDFIFRIAARVDGEGGGIADFLALLKPYIDGDEEKMDLDNIPRPAADGVRIMTIHKSKGLQFPMVVVPWAENAGSARRENPLWHPLGRAVAIDVKPYDVPGAKASNIVFDMAKEEENAKDEAEIRRLLYVACTRAEDHLAFFAKSGNRSLTPRSFSYYLDAYAAGGGSGTGELLAREELPPAPTNFFQRPSRPHEGERLEGFARAYAAASTPSARFPRRRFSATELSEARFAGLGEDASLFRADETSPRIVAEAPPLPPEVFGSFVHALLQAWIDSRDKGGALRPSAPPLEEILRLLPAAAPAPATSALEQAYGLATVLAENFLSSGLWRSLPPGAAVETEKAFVLSLGGLFAEGRMDFYSETETGILIVDFKTDMDPQPGRYAMQLDLYAAAARDFAPGKTVRCGLFLLRSGSFLARIRPAAREDLEGFAKAYAQALDRDAEIRL